MLLRMLSTAMISVLLAGCVVTPDPADPSILTQAADKNLQHVTAHQEPVQGAIDVYAAISRALKYNLDQRVELMQQAVRANELNLANYQGLPNLVAGSAYAGRNNYSASSSVSVLSARQSLEPSYSADRQTVVGDLTLSWNVLDFGLSYVRAKQAADQVLIQQEMRRRALNRIVEDVRSAFWRAVASERLLARLGGLEAKIRRSLADSRALAVDRQTSPVEALSYERELLEVQREAQLIEGELRIARSQLAALMNLTPGSSFKLTARTSNKAEPPLADWNQLVRIALVNRPEMRDIFYRQRINERELDAALLEMLPGLNLFVGANADSNSLLYNANWVGWGAKASWNVMKVFQHPAKKELIKSQGVLLNERSLAMTMAIMTQIHISQARYIHARKEFATARQLRNIQAKLLRQIRESTSADRTGEQTLIREELNTIITEVRYDLAYANLESAYGNIYASIGLDAFPTIDIAQASVAELAQALRENWVGRGGLKLTEPTSLKVASTDPVGP